MLTVTGQLLQVSNNTGKKEHACIPNSLRYLTVSCFQCNKRKKMVLVNAHKEIFLAILTQINISLQTDEYFSTGTDTHSNLNNSLYRDSQAKPVKCWGFWALIKRLELHWQIQLRRDSLPQLRLHNAPG